MEYDIKEFDEIRPYEAGEMKQAFNDLLNDRQFSLILKGFAPWLPKSVRNGLLRLAFVGVRTPLDFQLRFMKPIVWHYVHKLTDGLTFDDGELTARCAGDMATPRYTFVSNHRDIVLDSAFLDVLLNKHGYPTTVEIGIGDNLLIYPWIRRLVRMNKAFTVRRGLTAHEMMRSSQLMSRYIHYAVTQKRENIWIAQREGRAKDSNDRTQPAILKMMAMGGQGSVVERLMQLHIVPLAISYEFDPCDYLKAAEFQLKRDVEGWKKSPQDDVLSMRTGIMGYKGRIHYQCAPCIDDYLAALSADIPKTEVFDVIASHIDEQIHRNYRLYPSNYVALDLLEGSSGHRSMYTLEEKAAFEQYVEAQLAKIDIVNKDERFLRERMLTMYANPVRNFQESVKSV
jgi:hypothetical protein